MRRALLIGLVGFAAACSSSGSSTTAPTSTAAVATTSTVPRSTTTTVPHDSANTVTNFCDYAHQMTVALNSQPTQFNDPAYNKRVDTTALQAIKHASTIAPVALRSDFETVIPFYQQQYDALSAVGFDGNKVDQSKSQPTASQRAAVAAIAQFVEGTCHVNGNTTS